MQLATDILKLLFFPGFLFMAFCGGLLVLLEGRIGAAFYGGKGTELFPGPGGRAEDAIFSLGELVAVVLSLASLGVAGFLLVGVKGDIFTLLLLLSAVEMLPLIVETRVDAEETRLPLAFRTAFARLAALYCVGVCVSLRFPGDFDPGMGAFKGEGAFSALRLLSGLDFALILSALATAALALLLFHLGRPSCGRILGGKSPSALKGAYFLGVQGGQRAVTVLLYVILFLGYPWEGRMGVLSWSGAAAATVAVLTVARAWAEGRDRVTLRRWQEAGFILAVFSLILALAAAI